MRSRPRLSLLAVLLIAATTSCAPGRPESVRHGGAAADSIDGLDPSAAYRRALALGERQRFGESLVYFRRALAFPTTAWQPHCDYAITLFHAALEARSLRGRPQPAVRSSYERVAMMLEAGRELDLAERLARSDADRAFVIARRARHLAAWGLSGDAYLEYARAGRSAPEYTANARALLLDWRDPTRAAGAQSPP